MPRYFFDANDGHIFHCDLNGEEVRDLKHAQQIALKCLPEILRIRFADSVGHHDITIAARDSSGMVAFTICLSVHTTWANEV
jgi:hypothetical protein